MASFDENGKYIKTNWKAGDKITATKLNKIEESIEAVNDNDISRHVEADARLDALEAKDVAHDKEFTNVKNLIADNKAAAELGDYEINSRMQFLEDDVEQAVNDMNNAVTTIRNEMNTHTNTVNTNVNNKISAFETEFDAEVAGLKAVDEAIQNDVSDTKAQIDSIHDLVNDHKHDEYLPLSGGSMTGSITPESSGTIDFGSFDNGWGNIFVRGQYVSDVSDGEKHFGFYNGNNPVSYMFGKSDGAIGMYDKINEKMIHFYFNNQWYLNADALPDRTNAFNLGSEENKWNNIYSCPFNMFVEDNSYTSQLKANRGNFRLVDGYNTSIFSWSHDYLQIGPDVTNQINLGSADFRFKSLYLNAQPNVSSDRTLKENIKYVNSNESNVSYEDMYAFVKDDLELATYNLVEHDKLSMGFIAQDLLVNLDGTDNKVGQMIVNPVAVPTEEEIEEGTPYPTLSYDMGMYTSVLAGALKEAINKIEQLEARIQELENK